MTVSARIREIYKYLAFLWFPGDPLEFFIVNYGNSFGILSPLVIFART
jgi:hypothetical protein